MPDMRGFMGSINFEILRKQWPELAGLGGFAEEYVHSDPASALLKLRSYIEQLVEWMYKFYNLPMP
jgi:type I restriction enzyme, R subunit